MERPSKTTRKRKKKRKKQLKYQRFQKERLILLATTPGRRDGDDVPPSMLPNSSFTSRTSLYRIQAL